MSQKIANKGDGNQIAQFGGDLNGTLNQINGTRTLASLTLPELGEEYLLASSIVSRERKSRLKTSAIAALVCLLCCGITVVMYWLFGQPSLKEIIFSPAEGSKLELSMNLTLAIPAIVAALSGAGAYGRVTNPSELEVIGKSIEGRPLWWPARGASASEIGTRLLKPPSRARRW